MNPKVLILRMAERLYEDIKFVTAQNPTQIVDDDGARAYNLLVSKFKQYFAHEEFHDHFPEWQPRTIKYKDALIASGQLYAMMVALIEIDQPSAVGVVAAPPRKRPPAPKGHHTPLPPEYYENVDDSIDESDSFPPPEPAPPPRRSAHDAELYGPGPVLRNEDGTIPFSLD